jgi:hypothetical protein
MIAAGVIGLQGIGCSSDGGTSGGAGHAGNTVAGAGGTATGGNHAGGRSGAAGSNAGGPAGLGGEHANAGHDAGGTGGSATTAGTGGAESGGTSAVGGSSNVGGSGGSPGAGGSDMGAGGLGGGAGTGEAGAGGEAGQAGGNAGTAGSSGGAPATCSDGATRPCCHEGHQTCSGGVWGACTGAWISAESCNGVDDDCNGQVDELGTTTCGVGACATTVSLCGPNGVNACTPGTAAAGPDGCDGIDNDCDGAVDEDCAACIHVAPNGDDTAALADGNVTPFATVQAAIDFAETRPDIATRVCVAAGASCGASATFNGPSNTDLTMRNGIDVLGGYEATTFTRCTNSTTHLAPQTGKGVFFPANVTSPTTLDGFTIDRYTSGTSTTAVTLDGARSVMLSNLTLPRTAAVMTYSYGVTLANGATATIFMSTISGGNGSTASAAVASVGARVDIEDSSISASDSTTLYGSAEGMISLEASPGSRIERSTISGKLNYAAFGGGRSDAIAIHGNASGVLVRHNTISPALNGPTNAAISALDCAGASPFIADNVIAPTLSAATATLDSVYAGGDCKPVIDENPTIVATSNKSATGVHCTAVSGVSSACVISRNQDIGNSSVPPPSNPSTNAGNGIVCDATSCSRIDQNVITGIEHSSGPATTTTGYGIVLNSSNALVDRNSIVGVGAGAGGLSPACYYFTGYGVTGGGAGSRIQNNRIYGAQAGTPNCLATGYAYGLTSAAGQIYSNHIVAWPSGVCASSLNAGQGLYGVVTGLGGDYRNNAIEGCAAVKEANASSDPAVFEHNALATGYLDEGGDYPSSSNPVTPLSAAQVNALADMTTSGNIDAACYATGSDTLAAGSPCIDAGASSGAPTYDYDGQLRDATPDIGSDEF